MSYIINKFIAMLRPVLIGRTIILLCIEKILYKYLIIPLRTSSHNYNAKQADILLVRLDAIGDYILFRNFIEILYQEAQKKDQKLHFVGNEAWKDIFVEFDAQYFSKVSFINKKKFIASFSYRFKVWRQLSTHCYDKLISPIYSRDIVVDHIVAICNAKEKIGNSGDCSNIVSWLKKKTDKSYSTLLPAKQAIMFEFYRNKEFFTNLLNSEPKIKTTKLALTKKISATKLPSNTAMLFIGASHEFRKYSSKNFAKIAKFLQQNYLCNILLCGDKDDLKEVEIFEKLFDNSFINYVGKTSLIELIQLLAQCKILVSNETCIPHLAVALGNIETFVISNGNHFARFTPYPNKITAKYHAIYHPIIEKNLKNYHELSNSYGHSSDLNINEISVEQVTNKISKALSNKAPQV